MVTTVRAEAIITAQNKLRPGLASAAAELSRFRAIQAKATAAFSSTSAKMMAVAQQRSAAMAAAQSRFAAVGRNQMVTLGGPAALAAAYKKFADVDRQITRIGLTANASTQELAGVRKEIEGIANETAQSAGGVTTGLNVLVSQGRTLKDAMDFLPSVARTAQATGSAVDDIAKSADSVSTNFKIAGKNMQAAFDIMSEGGKAGQFELPDMARYIPSLGPATAAVGFSGEKGLADLVAMLQVMRKGSGTAEEAVSSMENILSKMESDKTTKGFKALGVDSAKAFEKGRKEGRNLVEVFEELLQLALKGDTSKLGEIIDDQQFKRGALALMTYRGEWQKTSKTIRQIAPGSVARDLTRVTNDARAQIDRMFSAVENRAVQAGGVLAKYLVLPLDEFAKKLERGENKLANRTNEFAQHHNADAIANAELNGEPVRDYDPTTRRLVDARKEFLQRQRIDAERDKLGGTIGSLQAARDKVVTDAEAAKAGKVLPASVLRVLDAKTKLKTDEIDAKLNGAQINLARLNALVASVDELNLRLAENAGPARAASSPRISRPFDGPGFAYVGPGATSFSPTLGGGGAVPSIQFGGVPFSSTLPPARPESLSGKAAGAAVLEEALPRLTGRLADFGSEVQALGGAGATAGSTMASGLEAGLSRMKDAVRSAVSEMQRNLNSLHAPSIGRGLGGFDTGRQGPN
jgi:TP901 family phage tail tape measure protein